MRRKPIPVSIVDTSEMSFLLSPDSTSSIVKDGPMTSRAKDKPKSEGFKKRESSHEARKTAHVSPFVLGQRKKGVRGQSKEKSEGGEKASKYCMNCIRLLSKGLSSAYCTMHSKYNAAPEEYLK